MIDTECYVINGWKVKEEQFDELRDTLYNISEDYLNDLDGFYIEDGMCGQYIYFGAILGHIDENDEPCEIVINEKLLFDSTEKYNKRLKNFPKYAQVLEKYTNNEPPQVRVFMHTS